MSEKISAQEYADEIIAPEYRQPLKTLAEALGSHGWAHVDRPLCCDSEVKVTSFIGDPYLAECATCGKFIVAVWAPSFGNSWVNVIDSEQVDLDTERLWLAGVRQREIACP